ncbi:G-D-S-L family lipolytic protein, partial [Pseudomonadota bacterium]
SGQEKSYPAILAQQFAKVGGDSNFTQPLVSDNLGGLLVNATKVKDKRLVLDLTDPENPSPEAIAGTPTTEAIGSGLNGSAFSNLGVPAAKAIHMGVSGYGDPAGILAGTANPYFTRFASNPATASMIGDAIAQAPSFYVMWAGNNDVLLYATDGGVGVDGGYAYSDITNPAVFDFAYKELVGELKTANPAVQGVLINIPDVKTIPYFTTVPYNPVPLDQTTADTLNAAYLDYNNNVAAILATNPAEVVERTISFSAGQNAVVILDEDLTDLTGYSPALTNMRQATADDLLVLTASTVIPLGGGTATPLGDEYVLMPSEIAAIDAARAAFNATIKNVADNDPNLILVDSAAILQEISTTGIDYGTGAVNADYATGGAFSLDGVHPTARGYAVVANRIIDAINTGFNASIPAVNPGDYTTIYIK